MRPPLLAPSGRVAVSVVLACGVVGVAATTGPRTLAAAVGTAALVLAWGWAGTLGLPTPRSTAVVLALGAVVTVSAATFVRDVSVWALAVAMGFAVVGALVHQLLRRDGRPRLVESVSSVVLGLAVVACGALWVSTARLQPSVVVVAVAAVAVSAVVDLLGRWPRVRPWLLPLGMLAGAAVASGAAALLADGPAYRAAVLLGVAGAAVSQCVRAVFSVLPTMAQPRPQLVSSLSSLLLCGTVGYAVLTMLY